MALFESYERREKQILEVLKKYGINSIEECADICKEKGFDPYKIVEGIQPICFENAKWAYTVGCAIAIKKDCKRAADAAAAIGEGLQSFCIPGSVADQRKVGLGHGNLGKMLLEEETKCFCFLAGHESFAAAEGAIGIAEKANKVRKEPLRVILNGLGKDAAQIIARINGFTFVETEMDYYTGEVKEVFRKCYSKDPTLPRALLLCGKRALTFPLPATRLTPLVSSTPLRALTRKSATTRARSTSPLLRAVVRAERSTPTIWLRVPLPTV